MIQRIGKNILNTDTGAVRSSQIVVHNKVAYLVCTPDKPYDPNASAKEQTQQVLDRIDRRLARINSSKDKLLSVTVIVSDMRFFNSVNEVWDRWIDSENAPVRACFEARLGKPDLKVEMVVQAACF